MSTSLHTLKDTRNSPNVQRVGRGDGSKRGKTSCRGHKGAKSRSGYKRRIGYEGGQFPLFRKIPYRGFSNHKFKRNVEDIPLYIVHELFEDGDTINRETLIARGLLRNNETAVIKLIGSYSLTKKFTVDVDELSRGANLSLTKSGSTVVSKDEA